MAENIKHPAVEEKVEIQVAAAQIKNITALDPTIAQKAWDELAQLKEKQGKINEQLILANRKLEFVGNTIRFGVENTFQSDYLTQSQFKSELIDYLREKTNCDTLNVEYHIDIRENAGPKIYTPTEKYQYLVQKYPTLAELKQKLGLELDF